MLDEREGALTVIKDQIEKRGHKALLIDISIGTGAVVPSLKADVSCEEIAILAGRTIEEVKRMLASERDQATSLMADGLMKKVIALHRTGELEGIIAIAGMTGTLLSLPAMNALPFGVPKLLISSVVAMPAHAKQFSKYFGLRDITVMHPVVDTVGMNFLVKTIALNGANAIAGMVEVGEILVRGKRPSIAITEFGFIEKGAHYVRELLEKDYEIVSFHATGLGDQAAADLVSQGFFKAFIDLVPASFLEYLLGGNRASGPNRLDASMNLPIPYIFAPGGFDMISCGPIERKDSGDPLWSSKKLAERKFLLQDPLRVQARTTPEEMEQAAIAVAEKFRRYQHKSKVKFLIPRKGFSSISVDNGALYDPASDEAFRLALKKNLDPEIKIFEVDSDINSREFAKVVVDALREAFNSET
jgi:uncharacterized protein (UPF0261 family)